MFGGTADRALEFTGFFTGPVRTSPAGAARGAGGLAILHGSGNTNSGANVFGGWEGRRYAPVKPFLEARFVFADRTSFNVLGGINFPL